MEDQYGPLPPPTLNLLIIALMKSYAARLRVKKISVGPKGGMLEFTELSALSDARISSAMDRWKGRISLEMTSAPVVRFPFLGSGAATMTEMTKFLKYAFTH